MAIEVTSWADVTQADYDAAAALITQIVVEQHPELDQRRGVISDIVLRLHGVLGGAGRVERERLLRSNSLLALATDPTLADTDVATALLSNYLVSPQAGDYARGEVTIVVSQAVQTIVPNGYVFLADNRQYLTEASYASRLNPSDILSDTDRLMIAQTDGTYTFTVPIRAAELGSGSRLRAGDALTAARPLANVRQIYAAADFTDGRNAESLNDLYSRLALGVAAKTWSNTGNLQALVREQTGFSDALVSVIRAGSPEMLRDKHGLFPLAYGNRVDLWLKFPRTPSIETVIATATYTAQSADGPVWRLSLPRTVLPGLYFVTQLLRSGRANAAAVLPTALTRGYTREATDPDMVSALEAAFSPFQELTVNFVDVASTDDVLVAGETTAEYAVTAMYTPDLVTLQELLTAPALAALGGDIVVRGATPCFVAVQLEVDLRPADLPEAAIASAVATYVNTSGFVGALYSSRIAVAIAALLPAGVNLKRVRLSGLIYKPDGTRAIYRDHEVLRVPYEPASMVSDNTVAFYLNAADVSIILTTD